MIKRVTTKETYINLCMNTTGKEMQQCMFVNDTGQIAVLYVTDTVLAYSLFPDEAFYCVVCNDEFVITTPRVCCDYDVYWQDVCYEYYIDNEGSGCRSFSNVSIGSSSLFSDGSIELAGYRLSRSIYGNPFVYWSISGLPIDSKGHVMIKEEDKRNVDSQKQYISVLKHGNISILSDRRLSDRNVRSFDKIKAVDINYYQADYSYLSLGHKGDVWLGDGVKWFSIKGKAYAISGYDHHYAVADEKSIRIYYEKKRRDPVLIIPLMDEERVTELAISDMWLAYRTLFHGITIIRFHGRKYGDWKYEKKQFMGRDLLEESRKLAALET